MNMTAEFVQAFASVDVPQLSTASALGIASQDDKTHPARGVVAPTNDLVTADLDTSHAMRVTDKLMHCRASFDIPYTERCVARSRHGDRSTFQDAHTAHSRLMPT